MKARILTDNDKRELLFLAGRLALCAEAVVNANALAVSTRIKDLQDALNDYNNAVFDSKETFYSDFVAG